MGGATALQLHGLLDNIGSSADLLDKTWLRVYESPLGASQGQPVPTRGVTVPMILGT